MRERPILFSAPMVRAILAGEKTQTRRVLKPYRGNELVNLRVAESDERFSGRFDDADSWGYQFLDDGAPATLAMWPELCPHGSPGDRLWVKETWRPRDAMGPWDLDVDYAADGATRTIRDGEFGERDWNMPKAAARGNVSPLFMPRWASRITLELTDVRVERLQSITPADIKAEGVRIPVCGETRKVMFDISTPNGPGAFLTREQFGDPEQLLRAHWAALWCQVNGRASWDANPWVWALTFKHVEAKA